MNNLSSFVPLHNPMLRSRAADNVQQIGGCAFVLDYQQHTAKDRKILEELRRLILYVRGVSAPEAVKHRRYGDQEQRQHNRRGAGTESGDQHQAAIALTALVNLQNMDLQFDGLIAGILES
jgi:hypothetical protein